jgi:phosphoribosylanthranilate isomerase
VGEISIKSDLKPCTIAEKFKATGGCLYNLKRQQAVSERIRRVKDGKSELVKALCWLHVCNLAQFFQSLSLTSFLSLIHPRVKICCISSPAEAQLAISMGASAVGLVGPMPSGPGVITDEQIAAIAQTVPPPVATFLLTSETDAEQIIAHQKRVHTNTIQMVDALQTGQYDHIRAALPGIWLVQVIHVSDERSVAEALRIAPHVDALLLDSGNPNLSVKELGGTGRVHDWVLSRQIRDQSPVPIFLAGGLHPDNVREAIEAVQPFGLDLCSGVRTNGQLDPVKLEAFMKAVNL